MALTAAEKTKRYKDKLKKTGGKTFSINISGEILEWITEFSQLAHHSREDSNIVTERDIVHWILREALNHRIETYRGGVKIRTLGGSLEQIEQFYKDCRPTIPEIDRYLPDASQ